MRTMRQIENEALAQAKARAEELCGESPVYFGITKNEIIAFQVNLRFGEKCVEMHKLLVEVEKFLNNPFNGPDGGWDQDTARKDLRKKIGEL